MRAGPKSAIRVGRLNLSDLPSDGGERVAAFVAKYLTPPKGEGHGEPFELRDWQRDLVDSVFDRPRPRSALWAIPRGNGKSSLAAALAIYCLFADKQPSPQVLVIATSEKQAGIVFEIARTMIEQSPPLLDRSVIYADRIIVPETNGLLMALPAEEGALQGYDPSMAIVDEIGYVTDPVFEAVMSASGKRPRSLVLSIGTPSPYREGPMWRMVERGRRGDDKSFVFREFTAPMNCDADDEEAWKIANPAMTGTRPFLYADAMKSVRMALRESEFRRLRLGQWVEGEESWIGWDEWAKCAYQARTVQPGEKVVLGFDGSYSGDSTALVGCTVNDAHLFVVDVWEKQTVPGWRVNRTEVIESTHSAFERYDVVEMAADPFGWQSELEGLQSAYGDRVIIWPTNARVRMAPATDRLFQAVQEQAVTHDGDQRLARHVTNAIAVPSTYGDLIYKPRDKSPRKIDAAVAAIVAFDRASWHKNHQEAPKRWAVAR
ncbi:terminase [Planomonospora venezuelensis]|nr:terminase [Planomonospora venezuelensis]